MRYSRSSGVRPQLSLLARIASAVLALLSLILMLNLLRYRGTTYYFGLQEIPKAFTGDPKDNIVTWHYTVSVSFLAVGCIASVCASRWTLERGFLISFHVLMFGCYFIAAIVLIIWLSSEESPSQYDYTQAGPTASGLTITSCVFSCLSAALALYGIFILKAVRRENTQQPYVFEPDKQKRAEINEVLYSKTSAFDTDGEEDFMPIQKKQIVNTVTFTENIPQEKSYEYRDKDSRISDDRFRSSEYRSRKSKGREQGNRYTSRKSRRDRDHDHENQRSSRNDRDYISKSHRDGRSKKSYHSSRKSGARSNIDEVRLPMIGERHYCRSAY